MSLLAAPPQGWFKAVGPFRVILAAVVVVIAAMAPLATGTIHGWGIIPSQAAPGAAVFIAWALPFDILMAKLFYGEQGEAGRVRIKAVRNWDLGLLALLLVSWGPFFIRLLIDSQR